MKSNIELQGLSLLNDTKASLKKKLYRHIVGQVERKFAKDHAEISLRHLMLIFLYETRAIHGLLDQAITGKLKQKSQCVRKLIQIMTRNLQTCLQFFLDQVGGFMVYIDCPLVKAHTISSEESMVNFLSQFQDFVSVFLKSFYYYYALGKFESKNLAEQNKIFWQCRKILQNFILSNSKHTSSHIIIAQTMLLLMSTNMYQGNYEEAECYLYDAVTFILGSLRTAYSCTGSSKNINKEHQNRIRQLKSLLLIAILNSQRMLIVGKGNLSGWDFGFGVLKTIQKMLGHQGNWTKYIRIQYEIHQIKQSNDFHEVRDIFIPFLTNSSQIIEKLSKQKKEYKNNQHFLFQQFEYAEQRKKISLSQYNTSKLNETDVAEPEAEAHKRTDSMDKVNKLRNRSMLTFTSKKDRYQNPNKKHPKIEKKSSINWTTTQRPQSQLSSTEQEVCASNNFTQRKESVKEVISNRCKQFLLGGKTRINNKKIKRMPLNTSILTKQRNPFQNITYDNEIMKGKELIKQKSKNLAFHQLITQPNESQLQVSQPLPSNLQNIMKNQKKVENKNEQSFYINSNTPIDNFIKLLTANKKKLGIKHLCEKYDQTRKRKKARNYHIQVFQLDLQKRIGDFISCSIRKGRKIAFPHSPHKPQKQDESIFAGLKSLLHGHNNKPKKVRYDEKTVRLNESDVQNSFNKSKYAINEMLKKIEMTKATKNRKVFNQTLKKLNNFY